MKAAHHRTLVNCTVSPSHLDAGSTLLVNQATGSGTAANALEVRCRLSTLSQVQCRRQTDVGQVTVAWQTFETPTGLTVQRLSATSCPNSGTILTLPTPVTPANTFLTEAFISNGSAYDDEDMSVVRLISSTQVQFETDVLMSGTCTGYDVQLVELAGAQVVTGGADAGLGIGTSSVSLSVMPPASDNSVLFTQARTPIAATVTPPPKGLCGLFVRGDIATPTTLSFTRGSGTTDGGCAQDVLDALYYQRVDFGARAVVQKKIVTLSTSNTTVAITAVDLTRTLVIAGGQQFSGQSTGESSYNAANDSLGVANAQFDFVGDNMVRVTRGRNLGTSVFTLYVVELVP